MMEIIPVTGSTHKQAQRNELVNKVVMEPNNKQ